MRVAAQGFVDDLSASFSSIVLARLFLVVPFGSLPPEDRAFASALVKDSALLSASTRVLSLLGTAGREHEWNDRLRSRGHLAVPLLSQELVQGIPMLARLLAELEVDFAALDDGRAIASTRMLGGQNAKFFVGDASTARNARGDYVIPARDFVTKHSVRTVFGMGGAYVDGTLAVAVVFSSETIDPLVVARFPSLISNFKMATAKSFAAGHLY